MYYLVILFGIAQPVILPVTYPTIAACEHMGQVNAAEYLERKMSGKQGEGYNGDEIFACVRAR